MNSDIKEFSNYKFELPQIEIPRLSGNSDIIPITVSDLIGVINGVTNVDITPSEITTTLNDSSTDAISNGLVMLNGNVITFKTAGTYYLTVDVRQTNRKMTRTFMVNVEEHREPTYGFVYLTVPVRQKHSYVYEPRWCYCRSEYNPATGDFTSNTILQIYPYTDVSGLHFTTYSYQPDIDKVERLDEWVMNVYSGGLGQAVSYIDVKDINKSTGKP